MLCLSNFWSPTASPTSKDLAPTPKSPEGKGDEDGDRDEPLIKFKALAVAALASLSGWLLGYDIGVVNGALLPLSKHFGLSHSQMELLVGTLNAIALPGTFLASYVADRWGRKRGLELGSAAFMVGNLLMTFATSYEQFVLGRAIAGFAVGLALVLGPLFTAEASPAKVRGLLTSAMEISLNLGILGGYVAGWSLSGLPTSTSWRWMIGISLIAPVCCLIGTWTVVPESPRWLAVQGRLDEAETVLHQLLGRKEASRAFEKLKILGPDGSPTVQLSWWEMLESRHIRGLLYIGGFIAFFGQATGNESIIYYSNFMLTRAGMPLEDTLVATILIGVVKTASIAVGGALVDRWGRVPLLITSSLGMAACMAGCGFAVEWSISPWWQVLLMLGSVCSFSIGYGPVTFIVNAEIYPKSCRSKGLAFAMGVGRITSALVASSFLTMIDVLRLSGAFFCFALFGLLAALFIATSVPETARSTLEEHEENLAIALA